jgi:lactoylglutathione lyase
MKIAHVALWTRDLEGAAAFWRDYFGAAIGERYESRRRPGFTSRFATLPGGGPTIELMAGPWVEPFSAAERLGWTHIAVSLGSREAVDQLAARCDAAGLLVSAARTTGDGYYEAVVKMPEGTLIEITA